MYTMMGSNISIAYLYPEIISKKSRKDERKETKNQADLKEQETFQKVFRTEMRLQK